MTERTISNERIYLPADNEFNEINAIIPVGLVRMLMKLLADMAQALQVDAEKIPKWLDIAENLGPAMTIVKDGKTVLCGTDNIPELHKLCLRYMFPAEQIGKYSTPDLYEAAQNSVEEIAAWDNNNLFCEFYPAAARLAYPPNALIEHIHETIRKHGLPNGLYRFQGGGIENSAAIPGTVNEMLLQSYEHILRLFPCWDYTLDASFRGLRAYGAFVVNAEIRNGIIHAEIFSEKGETLRLEKPGDGYVVLYRGETIKLKEQITDFKTNPYETVTVSFSQN